MSAPSTAGPLSIAIAAVADLIANVPFFQTWTNTDYTHASGRIFIGEVGYPVASFAVSSGTLTVNTREVHAINVGDVITLQGTSVGAESTFVLDGTYSVLTTGSSLFTASTTVSDTPTLGVDVAFVLPCPRPYAVVGEDNEGLASTLEGMGGPVVFKGSAKILIVADVSPAYQNDQNSALTEARNALGSLIQGMMQTGGGVTDLIQINSCEPLGPIEFTRKESQDDNSIRFERWSALLRATWGLE